MPDEMIEEDFSDDERAAMKAALAESVRDGYLQIVGEDDDGEPIYTMTSLGRLYVESNFGRDIT